MVKGDIDLTENMDFYHDSDYKSQKKLPATIPWKRDKENSIKISDENIIYTNLATTMYPYTDATDAIWWTAAPATISSTNTISYSGTPTLNVSYTVTNYDNTSTYYYDITNIYDYVNTYWTYDSTIDHYDSWYDAYELNESGDTITIKWDTSKMYSNYAGESTNYPWYKKRKDSNNLSRLYFRSSKEDKQRKSDRLSVIIERRLKFAKKRDQRSLTLFGYVDKRADLLARISKRSSGYNHKIPWLSKLNSRIREDYLEDLRGEGKNYDSYLTNRSWLGMRD